MPSLQPFFQLIEINICEISKEEEIILKIELFSRLCEELKEILREKNKEYFHLLKLNSKKENIMIETIFIRNIINDILSTGEYTLSGIAYYTNTTEDILIDIVSGHNSNPSLFLSLKIIAIHRSVRPKLYKEMLEKIFRNEREAA